MATVAEFLTAAAAEIGTVESPAGSNRTEFAAEAGHANGYAWCQTFLNAIAKRVGLDLPAGVAESAYTPTVRNCFRAAGRWTEAPQVGAWAFFQFDSDPQVDHVAVVEAIHTDGTVTTIGGNTSPGTTGSQSNGGGVYRRRQRLSQIVGFGLPLYTAEVPATPPHVIVRTGSPEQVLVNAYPALFGLPVRLVPLGGVQATGNPADIAFGISIWGAETQIVGKDRYETLRLALDYAAKR